MCATNIACASDARLKQNVRPLDYGLSQLLRLRPARWEWKDASQRQLRMGLIAQEVEGVMPELVLREADPAKPLGLNYLGFMPVLIKAIQEQQTTLEQKDAELKRLKEEKDAEIKALNNRLTALEELMRQTPNQR